MPRAGSEYGQQCPIQDCQFQIQDSKFKTSLEIPKFKTVIKIRTRNSQFKILHMTFHVTS